MERNTILVVDDDDDIRELLRDRLEYMDHNVLTARNGREGVDTILAESPDLVLLDIQMPILDGFGVLREVLENGVDVPIIMITANGTVQKAVKAMQMGASDFLMKPFQPEAIEQRVNRALSEKALKLENIRLQAALAEAKETLHQEMLGELEAAHNMQMALMPEASPHVEGFDISAACIPSRQVGGDYYTFIDRTTDDDPVLGIFLADVSGKGMEAATVAMRLNEMFRYESRGRDSGAAILAGLDQSLRGRIPANMFSTCGIAFLDVKRRRLRLTSAACPEVYHYRSGERVVAGLGAYGFPAGLPFPPSGDSPFGSVEVDLATGDLLVFTSDAVEEAMNEDESFYGAERLMNQVRDAGDKSEPAEVLRDRIVSDVLGFIGNTTQRDDLTVIVLCVL